MGAGLVAIQDLPEGAAACSVPRSLLLTATSGLTDPELGSLCTDLQDEIEDESNNHDASVALIALQVLHAAAQVQRGETCRWAPYIACLPRELNTPVTWPRSLRTTLLASTTQLQDARELRANIVSELRRVRRRLRATGRGEWLGRLGLDSSAGACPLTGAPSAAACRWVLAQSLVRRCTPP
eukprot:6488536-Prymnesium_polylepis.2